ncbi:hypothetical protein GCM10025760_32240 [Microbacterium yannicii]|uniref:Uncharacterized protein n=1 Tax=Microbacterium yannicii TaxID=671622 RepID=A0ABP9MJW2_9MICO
MTRRSTRSGSQSQKRCRIPGAVVVDCGADMRVVASWQRLLMPCETYGARPRRGGTCRIEGSVAVQFLAPRTTDSLGAMIGAA